MPRPHILDGPAVTGAGRRWLTASAISLTGFVLLTLFVVQYANGTVDGLDRTVLAEVATTRSKDLSVFANIVTTLGAGPVVAAIGLLAAGWLWTRTRAACFPVVLITALAATAGIVFLSKVAVGRARPALASLMGVPSTDFSFPSGHTTDGTVVFGLIALLLVASARARLARTAVVVAGAIALLVGWSRVYLGYHWATDVIAGWLLATAIISAAMFAMSIWLPRPLVSEPPRPKLIDETVSPVSLPQGDDYGLRERSRSTEV